jgi:hypothetical protein
MFRIKIITGTGLAALVLATLGAMAPGASAKLPCQNPIECYGVLQADKIIEPLPPEPIINIDNAGVVEFTGGTLVVSCPQSQGSGLLQGVGGTLQASIGPMSFGGGGGAPCASSSGPAVVSAGPHPWPWTLKENGKAQVTGPLSLELGVDASGLTCFYSAKSIKGTYNTDEEPIVIGTKPPKFTEQPGSSPGCPKKGTLSSSWSVSVNTPAGGQLPLVFRG